MSAISSSAAAPTALSVVVIAYNEARHIGRCLASVRHLTDDLIVVDSGSTDGTEQIALAHGARIFQRAFDGYASQKNFGVGQARHAHILSLDADEALSPALAAAIERACQGGLAPAYTMNRLNNYLGRWLRYGSWYPDRKLRLWDSRLGSWGGNEVHETIQLPPGTPVQHLPADLLHYAFDSLDTHIARTNRYTSMKARRVAAYPKWRIWVKWCTAPGFYFFKSYVLKQGFREGFEGFCVASIGAWGEWLVYLKAWQLRRGAAQEGRETHNPAH